MGPNGDGLRLIELISGFAMMAFICAALWSPVDGNENVQDKQRQFEIFRSPAETVGYQEKPVGGWQSGHGGGVADFVFSNRWAPERASFRFLDIMREALFHHMEALVAGNLWSFCRKP